MSLLLFFTGTGVAVPVPPGPPAPIPVSEAAGTFIATGAGARLTQPLTRAEWQRLLRGDDERTDLERLERIRLMRLMLEDDLTLIMLL